MHCVKVDLSPTNNMNDYIFVYQMSVLTAILGLGYEALSMDFENELFVSLKVYFIFYSKRRRLVIYFQAVLIRATFKSAYHARVLVLDV